MASLAAALATWNFHNALRRNLDLFASRGIAAEAGSAVLELQLAEARQREGVLSILVSQISQRFEVLDRLLFRDPNLLRECGGDLCDFESDFLP